MLGTQQRTTTRGTRCGYAGLCAGTGRVGGEPGDCGTQT